MSIIKDISGTKITVSVDSKIRTFDVQELLDIDDTNLSKEFANQASLYGYFATMAVKAEHRASILAMKREQEYALADQEYREELEEQGKKSTEPMIKNLVMSDENYAKVLEQEYVAKYDYDIIKAVTKAMEQRAQMLISLGNFMRHEYEMTDMKIRERQLNNAVDDVKSAIKRRR
jgi:hypothetical protein